MENLEQHILEKNLNIKIKNKTKETFRNQFKYKFIKELIKDKEYWNLIQNF
jgi:hypothetical protein